MHITGKCKDYIKAKVLIHNGLSLNMLLRHILNRLLDVVSYMLPSNMIAKVYDGSLRQMIGDIDVDLIIASH